MPVAIEKIYKLHTVNDYRKETKSKINKKNVFSKYKIELQETVFFLRDLPVFL